MTIRNSQQDAMEAQAVTVAYQSTIVLRDISFRTPSGTLTAIIGPNGAGKSTLLKAALGLVKLESGSFRFFGDQRKPGGGQVAYIPQRTSVDWDFPITALEVVCMGLYAQIGWFRPVQKSHRNAAREALQKVGIEQLADRQISQLSGGQQQRVFLARALVQNARLYLMDEPLAGVDAATEQMMMNAFRELRDHGCAAMVVHHDLQTVEKYFDRVLLLNQTVIAEGPASETFERQNLQAAFGGQLIVLN